MKISERAKAAIVAPAGPKSRVRKIECPVCAYTWVPGKERSVPQHRRFFGIVSWAFDNWPETHPFQFASVHKLRKWLIVKAGYFKVKGRIPLDGIDPTEIVVTAHAIMQAADTDAVLALEDREMHVLVADSIRFDKMGPKEFGDLCEAVCLVIEKETGLQVPESKEST